MAEGGLWPQRAGDFVCFNVCAAVIRRPAREQIFPPVPSELRTVGQRSSNDYIVTWFGFETRHIAAGRRNVSLHELRWRPFWINARRCHDGVGCGRILSRVRPFFSRIGRAQNYSPFPVSDEQD
jgi:hypothetical protein